MNRVARSVGTAVLAAAVLAATLLIFGLPIGESLRLLAAGAFGDKYGLHRTLLKTIPLLTTGAGMVVAWRAGMYNIGGEGQFVVGGLAGCLVAKLALRLGFVSEGAVAYLILLGCVIGGALWAGLAGWLFVKRGVQTVISTILLNFIALQGLDWAVSGPLQEGKGQLPLTDQLPQGAMLARLDRQTNLHSGLFIALAAVGLVYLYLFFTKSGYRLRLVGESPRVARSYGTDAGKAQLGAMLLSGGLCGLGGGIEYVGFAGQLGNSFSQNWGFLAIPVALLAGLHPLWVLLSALYFGALFAGSENLARFTTAGSTLIYVVQGGVILAIVGVRALSERRALRKEVA